MGTIVVSEAPGADHGALFRGQGAADQHGPWPAERDFACLQDAGESRCPTIDFVGLGIDVAHRLNLSRALAVLPGKLGDGAGMAPLGKWSHEATVF